MEPLERQVAVARIPSVAGAPPEVTLARILSTIRTWCFSDELALTLAHMPAHLGAADQAAFLALAERVWAMMFRPLASQEESLFSIRGYHLVKWLDLAGADIPRLGTLLVDEGHDLPPSWRSLLARYSDGWVIMSDPYQYLPARPPRMPPAKGLTMAESVRTGEQAMPLVRDVLQLHSERLVDDDIRGSRGHLTRTQSYRKTDELPTQGLRIFGVEWSMLEDALRLKNAGVPFRFVPASIRPLEDAVRAAIRLRRLGITPRVFHLQSFTSWDALAEHLRQTGHMRVAKLFERNFTEEHLSALLRAQDGDGGLILGLLEHCKNLEASVVVMWPCCFIPNAAAAKGRDTLVKAVYLALTRVRDELWIPGDAYDRLVDLVAADRRQT